MKLMLAGLIALVLIAPASAQLAEPNEAGVAMGHVHLNVNDVDAQKKFWTEQFAAVPLKKEGLQGVKIPGMLILLRKRVPTGPSEGTMMDHFGLKVHSTAEVVKSCRAAGYQIQREFKGSEGFPNAYVIGPDGVRVEIQEDTTLAGPPIAYHLHYMNREGDQKMYSKILMTKDFQFTKVIFQMPGQSAMEMPMNSNEKDRAQMKEDLAKWSQVGTETITVPAGTFSCSHWKKADGTDEVWASDKVTPLAMVKKVGKNHSMVLVRQITNAQDHITGPVTPFDPKAFMKSHNQ